MSRRKNDCAVEKFVSRETCENQLPQFIGNRDKDFYENGVMKLLSKWQNVFEQCGTYLT